jgi:hypothetical protein
MVIDCARLSYREPFLSFCIACVLMVRDSIQKRLVTHKVGNVRHDITAGIWMSHKF